jgi:hypothetical protein
MMKIEANKGNGYRPQNKNQSQQRQQHQTNQNNGPVKCTHSTKPGDTVEKCFVKFPGLRNQNQNDQGENSAHQRQNNAAKKLLPIL